MNIFSGHRERSRGAIGMAHSLASCSSTKAAAFKPPDVTFSSFTLERVGVRLSRSGSFRLELPCQIPTQLRSKRVTTKARPKIRNKSNQGSVTTLPEFQLLVQHLRSQAGTRLGCNRGCRRANKGVQCRPRESGRRNVSRSRCHWVCRR